MNTITVQPAAERSTVQTRWADGKIFAAPIDTTLETFARAAYPSMSLDAPIVAALLDGLPTFSLTIQPPPAATFAKCAGARTLTNKN
ncbi:MAG: hypothetical protein HZC38_13535 [Chloroflexi bacterium]|nr:hypothetical protein [Chloroflexota bacterium]